MTFTVLFTFKYFLAPSGNGKLLDFPLAITGSNLKHNETLSKMLLQDDGILKDENVSVRQNIQINSMLIGKDTCPDWQCY